MGQDIHHAFHTHPLIEPPQQPGEAGPLIIPILQTRNLKLREVKPLAQGHTARRWGMELRFYLPCRDTSPKLWVNKDWGPGK